MNDNLLQKEKSDEPNKGLADAFREILGKLAEEFGFFG